MTKKAGKNMFVSTNDKRIKLERLVNREQTALLPAKSRSPKKVLLMVCYDTARGSLIQLF